MGKQDIEIARAVKLQPIQAIGENLGLNGGDLEPYGSYKAKIRWDAIERASTAAHNLLAAMLDNHLAQGNALGLDVRRILWKRVLDMNDRSLRRLIVGLGGPAHGVPRESGFDITVASEIMAILCLARDLQ